jgi:hypothetical protein
MNQYKISKLDMILKGLLKDNSSIGKAIKNVDVWIRDNILNEWPEEPTYIRFNNSRYLIEVLK